MKTGYILGVTDYDYNKKIIIIIICSAINDEK